MKLMGITKGLDIRRKYELTSGSMFGLMYCHIEGYIVYQYIEEATAEPTEFFPLWLRMIGTDLN